MSKKEKEDKDKKKKARKALVAFLRNLKKTCGSFQSLNEWYGFLQQNLDPLIAKYHEQIPTDVLKHFNEAKHRTDHTTEAINKACSQLQWNVEKVINMLPKHSPLAKFLIAGVAVTSGVTVASVLYLKTHTVTIIVKNRGCDQIQPVLPPLPVPIPGLQLFEAPIPNGGQGIVKIYPLPVTVDATQKGTLGIGLFGATPVLGAGNFAARDIRFDGVSLLGKKSTLNLGERDEHELIISCR